MVNIKETDEKKPDSKTQSTVELLSAKVHWSGLCKQSRTGSCRSQSDTGQLTWAACYSKSHFLLSSYCEMKTLSCLGFTAFRYLPRTIIKQTTNYRQKFSEKLYVYIHRHTFFIFFSTAWYQPPAGVPLWDVTFITLNCGDHRITLWSQILKQNF